MKVTENTKVRDKVLSALKRERFTPKTFSVTGLVMCPRRTYYRMKGEKEVGQENVTLVLTRGRALHKELGGAFKLTEIHREADGIRGDIDAVEDNVIEFYTTNLSLKNVADINKVSEVFKIKVRQLMAYCYMTKERVGDLLVLFMSGDYSRYTEIIGKKYYTGIQPVLKCWTLEFTEDELKENWKKILSNKEDIEYALKTGMPPLTAGEEFECNNCGYSYICFGEEPVTEAVQGDIK